MGPQGFMGPAFFSWVFLSWVWNPNLFVGVVSHCSIACYYSPLLEYALTTISYYRSIGLSRLNFNFNLTSHR